MSIHLKAESQFVGGVYLRKGINNISEEDYDKISKDSWGKMLIESGLIAKVEMRTLSEQKRPTKVEAKVEEPKKPTKKKGNKRK
jgi:hypothetical protein